MKRAVLVTRRLARYGFELAGFQQIITDEEHILEILEESMGNKEIGLLVVDESLLQVLEQEKVEMLEKRWDGVLVALPAPVEEEGLVDEDYAMALISRVLGYRMKVIT